MAYSDGVVQGFTRLHKARRRYDRLTHQKLGFNNFCLGRIADLSTCTEGQLGLIFGNSTCSIADNVANTRCHQKLNLVLCSGDILRLHRNRTEVKGNTVFDPIAVAIEQVGGTWPCEDKVIANMCHTRRNSLKTASGSERQIIRYLHRWCYSFRHGYLQPISHFFTNRQISQGGIEEIGASLRYRRAINCLYQRRPNNLNIGAITARTASNEGRGQTCIRRRDKTKSGRICCNTRR